MLSVPELGEAVSVDAIEITETLYYYDGPLIVLASLDGQSHYGHLMDRDGGCELFVYVPVGPELADDIKRDRIDLRDVLAGADRALIVAFDEDGNWTARSTTGSSLPEKWLPDPLTRLTLEGTVRAAQASQSRSP